MKTTRVYKLYISYRANQWHYLNRSSENLEFAKHISEEIAKEHKQTTRIAITEHTVIEDTIDIRSGTSTEAKPSFYFNCPDCGKKKARKNMNTETGKCNECSPKLD